MPNFGTEPRSHAPAEPCDCGGCPSNPRLPRGIQLFSGEFYLAVEDLRIPGRGLDFVWVRKYRSQMWRRTAQGHNWDHSYNIRIEPEGDGLALFDGNGRRDVLVRCKDGTFERREFFGTASRNTDGTITITFADTGTWNFLPLDTRPERGFIRSIRDRNGNQLRFSYGPEGSLTQIVDTLGRSIRVTYNANGLIDSVEDFNGREVRYEYYRDTESGGSAGDLKSATSPSITGTPNGNDFPTGTKVTYRYTKGSADDRLNHSLVSIKGPRGQTFLTNEYATTPEPSDFHFTRLWRQTLGKDVTDIAYSQLEPTAENGGAVILATLNDGERHVREYLFDARNRCVTKREYTGRAPKRAPVSPGANRPGLPLRTGDPKVFETQYAWNDDSLLTFVTYPDGSRLEKQYESDLTTSSPRRQRGNLRGVRVHPAPGLSAERPLDWKFEYFPGFGCTCATNFVTAMISPGGSRTVREFDERGNLRQLIHPVPEITEEFEYNAFGQLTRHLHPANAEMVRRADHFTWYSEADGHQNGMLRSEVMDAEHLALTSQYEYDKAGNLIRAVDPEGHDSLYAYNQHGRVVRQLSAEVLPGVRYQTDVFYDAAGNAVRIETQNRDPAGILKAPAVFVTARDYDVLNRCVRETRDAGPGQRVAKEFAWNANGDRTLVRYGEAVNGKQPANCLRLVYDERGLLYRRTRAPGDKQASTTQFDYDAARNLVAIRFAIEGKPQVYQHTRDGFGRVIGTTAPDGLTFIRRYDANSNPVHHQFTEASASASGGGAESVRLAEAVHEYDAMDRRVRTITEHFDTVTQAPIGSGRVVLETRYNGDSAVSSTTDGRGHATSRRYDTANRLIEVRDARGHTASWFYDRNSNIIATSSFDAVTQKRTQSTISRDPLGRPVLVTNAAGNKESYAWDSRNNQTAITDARGVRTILEFDGLNRPILVQRPLSSATATEVEGAVLRFSWDDSSRMVSRTDPNGNVTEFTWDALDRETSTVYADGSAETRTWDVHGNCVAMTDPNGTVVHTAFDARNRPVQRTIKPGAGVSNLITTESWGYDGFSRLTRARNDVSSIRQSWDSLSNLLREDTDGRTVAYEPDASGNRTLCRYPSGYEVRKDYDELDRVIAVRGSGAINAKWQYAGDATPVQRYVEGPEFSVTTRYERDNAGRLTAIQHTPANSGIRDLVYEWDPAGNNVRRSELRNGAVACEQTFEYDCRNRLISSNTKREGGQRRTIAYQLDAAGNRMEVTGGKSPGRYELGATTTPTYRLNQYVSTPVGQFAYDRNGNIIGITAPDGSSIRITHDYRNRVVEYAVDKERRRVLFTYDSFDRLITRTAEDGPTQYVYSGSDLIEEQDAAGTAIASYIYGPPRDGVFGAQRGRVAECYHTDALGSIVAVTGNNNQVLERYEYDDFGEVSIFDGVDRPLTASAANPFLFTGFRWDAEIRSYYCLTRYLHPASGRFISRDRAGLWHDAGNLGNGYTYAQNNPWTLIDPTGESTYRNISCNGPWPGPKTVQVEYEDCSSSRREALDSPVCRAFRSSGRGFVDVQDLWMNDLLGVFPATTGTTAGTIRNRVKKWFGGPDNATSVYSKTVISNTLHAVFEALKTNDVDIDCETGCDGAAAYVNWGGSDVNVCALLFNSGFSNRKIGAILVHELTHAYDDTDDFGGIYPVDGSNLPWALLYETPTLREYADSYMQFVLEWYT